LFAVRNKIPKQNGWRFVSSWKASRTVRRQEKQPLLNSNEPSWLVFSATGESVVFALMT
jgi:hypothetical protein